MEIISSSTGMTNPTRLKYNPVSDTLFAFGVGMSENHIYTFSFSD